MKLALYLSQLAAIFVVICTCLINLSLGIEKTELWASLLSACIGYLLPTPKFRNKNGRQLLPNASKQQLDEVFPQKYVSTLSHTSDDPDTIDGPMGVCPGGNDLPKDLV